MDIELLSSEANQEAEFTTRFTKAREVIKNTMRTAREGMREVLRSNQCLADTFGNYYADAGQHVGLTCRGCPYCRLNNIVGEYGFYRLALEPHPPVRKLPDSSIADPLATYRDRASWLSLWWRDVAERRTMVPELLSRLAGRGLTVLSGPGATEQVCKRVQQATPTRCVIRDADADLLDSYAGPVVWLGTTETAHLPDELVSRLVSRDVTYVIHPASTFHPFKSTVRLRHLHDSRVSVAQALKEL